MRYEPSLLVNRLRVDRGSKPVYDERFHLGVNIIRGENSSGKSTILNFLYYALGGDLSDWSEAARLCTRVHVEVSLNGKLATLSRDVSTDAGQPMDIFGGPMELALNAPQGEWTRYPYKRSSSKESFSQAIFRLLHLPEASNDVSGNITIHQVLRLLYADQLSPVEHIFKFQPFDSPVIRAAIGRLICGAYDNEVYQNEIRIRELTKALDSAAGELRSLHTVLGKTQDSVTLSWISAQRQVLLERQAALLKEIEQAERQLYEKKDDELTLKAQESAYAEVRKLQIQIDEVQQRHDNLSLVVADSNAFVRNLEQKLEALNDAKLVSQHIESVEFQSCPACMAPITASSQAHVCHLCKTPFESDHVRERLVSLINDAALQLRQSRLLQEKRQEELSKLSQQLVSLREAWKVASERLQQIRQLPSTENQELLRDLHQEAGYLRREIEDLETKARIANLLQEVSDRKAQLSKTISVLKDDNEARLAEQEKRLSLAYTAIADEIRELLHRDLRRQDSFENANDIQFDFGANTITVDGNSYFSASSRAILKSSFFVGILAAALKNRFFRHPRFVMLDTIEDKGMEAIRSQNFQNLIVQISESSDVEHQIIFATAMIDAKLDQPRYTVGRASTRDQPTLDLTG